MAPTKDNIPSFDDIIQAGKSPLAYESRTQFNLILDRQRRKNEQLAKEIFGRSKNQKPNQNDNRKQGSGPSLASRVGIAKVALNESSFGKRRHADCRQ